jgi:hypothetical protein
MKKFPLASTLDKLLRNELGDARPGIEIFAFGSVLTSGIPHDVDLLLIFDAAEITIDEAITLRKRLRDAIQTKTNLPADITLLSVKEAEQAQFLHKIDAVHLFPETST